MLLANSFEPQMLLTGLEINDQFLTKPYAEYLTSYCHISLRIPSIF